MAASRPLPPAPAADTRPAYSVRLLRELYVSTDIEADGPIPGPHSMLSLGSAAFTAEGELIATWSANLQTLPGATGHPKTMAWWETQPHAWQVCREHPQPPERAMHDYCVWVEGLAGRPVFVAYPAGFDFTFVSWYLMRFTGRNPFSFAALDIKTYAMAVLGRDFHETTRSSLPAHWRSRRPHTHVALDDALEQGELFCNVLAAGRARGRPPASS